MPSTTTSGVGGAESAAAGIFIFQTGRGKGSGKGVSSKGAIGSPTIGASGSALGNSDVAVSDPYNDDSIAVDEEGDQILEDALTATALHIAPAQLEFLPVRLAVPLESVSSGPSGGAPVHLGAVPGSVNITAPSPHDAVQSCLSAPSTPPSNTRPSWTANSPGSSSSSPAAVF